MRLKHLITAFTIMGVGITMAHAQEVKQTVGRTQLGEFAPKFAELNDDVSAKFGRELISCHYVIEV